MGKTHVTTAGGTSLADDEAALKAGKGGMLAGLVLVVVAALVGLWLLMSGGDQQRVYGELGRKINGLGEAHFDQFWGCALPGANLKDIRTNTDLITQVDGRAAQGRSAYAVHVRDRCLPKLGDIEPQLDTLIIPDDLKADIEHMKEAASKLRSAWSALVSFMDNPEQKYDASSAHVYLDKIARGWFDFKQAQGAINRTLKARISAR